MDVLTGRTLGTYARFERGRLPRAGEKYLREVAGILRMSETHWQGTWIFLRGHQPPHPLDPSMAGQLGSHWQGMVDDFRQAAYVSDQTWRVPVHNKAFGAFFPGGVPPRNMMRWMLLDPAARLQLVDWHTVWAPLIVPQLRAYVAEFQHNEELRRLEADVLADPVSGPLYRRVRDAYLHPDGDVREMAHVGLGRVCTVQIGVSSIPGCPGTRLMLLTYYPTDRPLPEGLAEARLVS
jgi:hypothetical protein